MLLEGAEDAIKAVKVDSSGNHWIVGDHDEKHVVVVPGFKGDGWPAIQINDGNKTTYLDIERAQMQALGLACLAVAQGKRMNLDD